MSVDIQNENAQESPISSLQGKILLALTVMSAGRAMTLAFIGRAGAGAAGDPPAVWLMPLVGDAVVGIGALAMVYLIAKRRGLGAWTAVFTFHALASWDAAGAFLVHKSAPWPEFFMVELFGDSMFFMALALHLTCLVLLARPRMRASFGLR